MEFWKFELFTLLNVFVFFGNFVARVFPVFFVVLVLMLFPRLISLIHCSQRY